MYWIYFFASYFVGLFVFSFTVIVILTILVFGIPITKKLERLGLLKQNNKIVKRYIVSLMLLSVVFVAISLLTIRYFPNQIVGFFIGCGFSFLFGISKVGANKNNIADYSETNERDFIGSKEEIFVAILGK